MMLNKEMKMNPPRVVIVAKLCFLFMCVVNGENLSIEPNNDMINGILRIDNDDMIKLILKIDDDPIIKSAEISYNNESANNTLDDESQQPMDGPSAQALTTLASGIVTTKPGNSSGSTNLNEMQTVTTVSPSPVTENFIDETTFNGGMNHWDFEGTWGKFNLQTMLASQRPIPDYTTSLDHVVLLTRIVNSSSSIRKEFPVIKNGVITITQYLDFSQDLQLKGTAFNNDKIVDVFTLKSVNLTKNRLKWSTDAHDIPLDTPFTFKIDVSSSGEALWAVDIITVRGLPSNTDVVDTNGNKNNTSEVDNANGNQNLTTVSPDELVGNVTEEHSLVTAAPSTNTIGPNELNYQPVTKIEEVAVAMWNAFYVFLALFCACLIALIVMIAKQQCRDDTMPPPTHSYSPRSSSYPMRKPQDNPGYQTDPV